MATAKKKKIQSAKQSSRSPAMIAISRCLAGIIILLVFAGVIFLTIKGWQNSISFLFDKNPQFNVTKVDVSTDGDLPIQWLRGQVGIYVGDNLFSRSPELISEKMSQIPKVKSVDVQRFMPDRLSVKITERVPVARIAYKPNVNYSQVVDEDGVVMAPTGDTSKMPLIFGVSDFEDSRNLRPGTLIESAALRCALDILDWSEESQWGQFVNVASVDAAYQDFVRVYLNDGTLVFVPQVRPQILDGKMRRLASVLRFAEDSGRKLSRVDLTVDGINVPIIYRDAAPVE